MLLTQTSSINLLCQKQVMTQDEVISEFDFYERIRVDYRCISIDLFLDQDIWISLEADEHGDIDHMRVFMDESMCWVIYSAPL